jgi:hypothetical protein
VPITTTQFNPNCWDHLDNDNNGYCDFNAIGAYCSDGSKIGDSNCNSINDEFECNNIPCGWFSFLYCGTNGFIGKPYCREDGNLYRQYASYYCLDEEICGASWVC